MFLIRVPHSSGMLEGHYTPETKFPPNDHRSHRPRAWLLNGVRKVEQLRFLERSNRTLGQAALLWLLKDQRIASTLPNIYDQKQLAEFAASSECPDLTDDEIERIAALYDANFGNASPTKTISQPLSSCKSEPENLTWQHITSSRSFPYQKPVINIV